MDDDEDLLAVAVVELIYSLRCHTCLVWAKSDALVERVLRLSPGQATGYVVMNNSVTAHTGGFDIAFRIPASPVVAMHHEMVSTLLNPLQILNSHG